jgi:hypothetical protein
MKIHFLTHYYPPEGNAPATRVHALAKRWAAAGHEVTVVTGVPNVPAGVVYPGFRNRLWPQVAIRDGVRVVRVWTFIARNKGTVRRIANYLSFMVSATLHGCLRQRPDVLIATSPQFFCGWAGVLTKWLLRLRNPFSRRPRFILEIRDIWPESIGAVDAISNRIVHRILECLERWMYRAADRVVTVGEGYRQRLLERAVPAERVSIVMNGVDRDLLEQTPAEPGPVRRRWGLEGRFVCAYIGTIGMASGLAIFLRAGRRLRDRGRDDIVLLAVGDGAVREELARQAAAEGLANVIFTGRVAKEEVPAVLAASDVCFVHLRKTPLFESVMPSKIFEAFGTGKAIIIGVAGEARALVERSGGGVAIPPEDDAALVEVLEDLAGQPQRLAAMGCCGRSYVLEHFDRDRLAAEYLDILEQELR